MTSTTENAPLLEATTEIDAAPEAVWAVVSDPRALGGLSDQVVRTHVVGTAPIGRGTRTINLNRRGLLVWPTRSKVVRFEPVRDFAFRIKDTERIFTKEESCICSNSTIFPYLTCIGFYESNTM